MTRTPATFKPIVFSDFRTDFAAHPVTGDIALVTNEDACKQALRNLMLTNAYERFWNPNFGGNVRGTLFELPSLITEDALKNAITLAIKNYEGTRIKLIEVVVTFRPDDDLYAITITFACSGRTGANQFTHFLKRNR